MQGCPGHNTIAAFVDGGLAEAELSTVEAHLDGCPECRRHISSLLTSPPSESFVFASPEAEREAAEVADAGEPPASLSPGARVGRFVVLRIVARGGMGTVARAYDPELDRRVALKVLRPEVWRAAGAELRAQLRREAVVMARLAHPNVVTVFDVGTWGEQVFIAMEYVAGSTLARWQEVRPWRERLGACLAAAGGLAAAHRAGVIHRDVKPANILCGDDGRVLVGDFGLAALEDADAGLVAGTPAYMAPEQMEGRPADERSDQFSFCVTAWEVLTGRRPFAGGDLDEIHAAIRRGPPAVRRGPAARVLAVLARGLAAEADQRHESMAALVAALERAAAPRIRRRWFAAGAGLAAAGLGAAFVLGPGGASGPRCGDGQERLAATWNPERRAALAALFPGADRFVARIDRQARDWTTAHADACRATHERGEQSAAMLDRRMSCLAGQLRELDALLDAVAKGGDPAMGSSALEAAHALPRPDACSAEAVAARGRPASYPDDPAAQAQAAEIDKLLDQATAQHRLARLEPEKALIERAVAGARALGDPVRLARALVVLGGVERRLNQMAAAHKTLPQAALVAAEAHDDEVAATAAAEMLWVVSQEEPNSAEAATWEQALERELARRPDPGIAAQLEIHRGIEAFNASDLARARSHGERALAMQEKQSGRDSPQIAASLRFLGTVQSAQGDHARAEKTLQRALDVIEAAFGPDHADMASGLSLLARATADRGDPARAVALFQRALAIREKVFGPDHPDVAHTLGNLGTALELAGDLAGARRAYQRSLALEEKALGVDSWESAPTLASLAGILAAQGDPGARRLYERAVALFASDKFPPDFADQTVPLAGLGRLLRRSGRCGEAAPHLARALAIHRVHESEPPPELVDDARACRVNVNPPRRSSR